MTESLEPLPPDIEELLAVERELPPEDDALKQRVLRGVTLAVGGASSDGEPDGGGTDGPGGGATGTGTTGLEAATHVATSGSAAIAGATKTIVGVGVAAFLAGGLAGSVLTTSLSSSDTTSRSAPTLSTPTSEAPDERAIAPTALPSSSTPAPTDTTGAPEPPAAAVPPRPSPSSDLDRERELLDVARAALGRGNAGGALEALAKHTKQFPSAQLGEERHALMVQALVAAGRSTEARSVATKFRARYPTSMLRPVVDAASPP